MSDTAATPAPNLRGRLPLLLFLGLLAFLVGLVVRFPATQAWQWLAAEAPVEIHGLRGTIWNGEADTLLHGGQRLESLHWDFQPGELLRGRLSYTVHARAPDGRINGRIGTGPARDLQLRDLRVEMSTEALLGLIGEDLPVDVGGRLDAFFETLDLDSAGNLQAVTGLINWTDGSFSLGEPIQLGSYALRLDGQDRRIHGQLQDTDAVLRLEGDMTLATESGELTGEVIMQALDGADAILVENMRFAGIPEPRAENRIRFNGNINNPLGFQGEIQ